MVCNYAIIAAFFLYFMVTKKAKKDGVSTTVLFWFFTFDTDVDLDDVKLRQSDMNLPYPRNEDEEWRYYSMWSR